jgi:tryptophan synthase alpha chain
MNRLDKIFSTKKANLLNIYFTAGFPKLEATSEIITALSDAGVDLIEIGMPYSDPLADGTTIQESSAVALQNGMSLDLLFAQIAEVRAKVETPLILMGYFNQVLQYGDERFFQRCQSVGVDGLILPDLPLDVYESDYKKLLNDLDLKISFLITPQTPDTRIKKVAKLSTSFVYVVSNYAITGTQSSISEQQLDYFKRIKAIQLKKPYLIGFGIADPKSFQTACQYANGAIIGSAFIKALQNCEDVTVCVKAFVAKLLQHLKKNS